MYLEISSIIFVGFIGWAIGYIMANRQKKKELNKLLLDLNIKAIILDKRISHQNEGNKIVKDLYNFIDNNWQGSSEQYIEMKERRNKHMKIVHFENDELLNNMYHAKFVGCGFEHKGFINPADNEDEFIDEVINEKPDLIITDINHKNLDGFRMLEILKEDSRTKDIPVVIMTNMSQEEDQERAKELGAADYIIKSQSVPKEVVERIKKVISK
jgi:CheY-like chemotaxis protein